MKEDEQDKGTVCLDDIDSNSQDMQLKFKLRLQERERLISLNKAIEIEIAKCLQDTKEQIVLMRELYEKELNEFFREVEISQKEIVKLESESKEIEEEEIKLRQETADLSDKINKEKEEWKKEDEEFTTLNNIFNNQEEIENDEDEEENKEEEDIKDSEDVIPIEKFNWISLSFDSCKIKFECFAKSSISASCIFLFLSLFVEKDFGLINIISRETNVNQYYIAFSIVRALCFIVNFVAAEFKFPIKEFFFFPFTCIFWILTSIGCVFLFPQLTGKNYLDSSNAVEISLSVSDKACILILQFFSSYISQVLSTTFFYYIVCLKFKQDWLTVDILQDKEKHNVISIFLRNVKVQAIFNSLFWILFFILISLSSISSIPNLDANVEIIIFGYLFPFIKASVVTLCYNLCLKAAEANKWSESQTSSMVSAFSAVAVIICSLPQLYFIFRSANDYSFFLYQYLPHEIIKKLSWLTFHPFYLKVKMQVVDILSSSFNSVFKNRNKVDPLGVRRGKTRRFTVEVNKSLSATAGEIVGRQLGEDLCMILMAIWMLPLCQEYLLTRAYPSSSSPPFPSYESIGVMIIGTAYGTETILTIVCFVILQRVGIPLMTNRQVLEFGLKIFLTNFIMVSCLLIVLAATLLY